MKEVAMQKVQVQMEMMPALMEKIHKIKMEKGRRTVVRRAVRRLDSQVRSRIGLKVLSHGDHIGSSYFSSQNREKYVNWNTVIKNISKLYFSFKSFSLNALDNAIVLEEFLNFTYPFNSVEILFDVIL